MNHQTGSAPRARRRAALILALTLAAPLLPGSQATASSSWHGYTPASRPASRPAPRTPTVQEAGPQGSLQLFHDPVAFEAAIGDTPLVVEDFDGGLTPPAGMAECLPPINSSSDNECFAPGQLVDGFSVSTGTGGLLVTLGAEFLGPGHTSTVVGANSWDDTTLVLFDEPASAGAMDVYEGAFSGPVDIRIFDAGDNLLGTTTVTPSANDTPVFFGFISQTPVGRIELEGQFGGGELIDNLRFHPVATLLIQENSVGLADSCVTNPGQSNGIPEPGETVDIAVPVRAVGADMTNVQAMLTLPAPPGVTYLVSTSTLGTIPRRETATAQFRIALNPGAMCLDRITLDVDVNSDQAASSGLVSLDVGSRPLPQDLPLEIPDGDPEGIESVIEVTDSFQIEGLAVRVEVEHGWVGDVVIGLTGPDGTSITLLDRPGVPETMYGCNNFDIAVTFRDGAPDPEDICDPNSVAPWPVSEAAPVEPLSTFIGRNVEGTWRLRVIDPETYFPGTLLHWELIPTPALTPICSVCQDGDLIFRDGFE